MDVADKRRLVPIEVAYYCMLGGLKTDEVAEGWYDPATGSVELVKKCFVERVTIDATFRVPPKETA